MLIKYSDGKSGIIDYLENGRKKDRDFARDEADKRVAIYGDIDVTRQILENTDSGYKHITLSFKEDEVSKEDCERLINEYLDFLMQGYDKSEFNTYAEIHYPKLKSYTAKNGELVVRKPHIHLVIPKTNLMSGLQLRPLGFVKQNIAFTDAFQEKWNHVNGFASPDLNHSSKISQDFKGRYDFEIFERDVELKKEITELILSKDIRDFGELQEQLKGFGDVKKSKATAKREGYLSVKEPHENKAVRLKEFIFSKDFIENYTKQEKINFLHDLEQKTLIKKSEKELERDLKQWDRDLKYWNEQRAFEVKYLDESSKFYKEIYKNMTQSEKRTYLLKKHDEFYKKYGLSFESLERPKNLKIDISKNKSESLEKSVVHSKLDELDNQKFWSEAKLKSADMAAVFEYLKKQKGVENLPDIKSPAELIGFLKNDLHFEKADFENMYKNLKGQKMESQINKIYNEELQKNKQNENQRTAESYLNAAALKYNGVSTNKLNAWLAKMSKGLDNADQSIFELFVKRSLENAQHLKDKGIMKETKKGEFEFANEKAKKELLENYKDSSKIQLQTQQAQEKKEIVQAKIEDIKTTQREFREVPVQVNIASSGMDVNYYQIGNQDVAGRFSGVLHDRASSHGDSAKAFVINDKAVSMEEFKAQKPELFESIAYKEKELFKVTQEEKFNSYLRINTLSNKVSLSADGMMYAQSQYNMRNELKPLQVGLTPFDKKLDKNFFQMAKDFITAKQFRDDLKVAIHNFKENIKNYFASKPELAASNIALAAQVKQLKQDLDVIKTARAAEQLIKEKSPKIEQESKVEKEEVKDKGLSLFEVAQKINKGLELGEKASNVKEMIIDPNIKDAASKMLHIIDGVDAKLINKETATQLFNQVAETGNTKDIQAASKALELGVPANSIEKIQKFAETMQAAAEMASTQNLNFEKLLSNVANHLKNEGKEKLHGNERS